MGKKGTRHHHGGRTLNEPKKTYLQQDLISTLDIGRANISQQALHPSRQTIDVKHFSVATI